MKYNAKRVGETLRRLRGDKTLSEVAKEVKISVSSLQMYEAGNRCPRDDVKIRIAKYYGKKVSSVFYFE